MRADATQRSALDRSLVHGIAWTSAVTWFGQIVTWAMTILVVGFLTREDYGVATAAAVYFGLIRMTSELGVGAAIVQFRTLEEHQVAQFNGLSVLAGLASLGVSAALSTPIALYFKEPRLPLVVVIMSLAFFINAFRVVPQSLMQRDLQFRRLALIEAAQAITVAISTVTLAALGYRYWALAWGPVVGATVFTALVLLHRRAPFAWPRLDAIRQPLTFSAHTLGTRLAWYGYSNADTIVIGRAMSGAVLGAWGVGTSLGGVAVEKVTALIVRVTPAIFAAVQNDLAEMRRYLLGVTEGLAMLTFPACVGMALVAPDLVVVLWSDEWISAILPIQLLAILAMVRSIDPLVNQVLSARGRAALNFRNAMYTLAVVPFGLYAGAQWGLEGVAVAALILVPLFFCRLLSLALRELELRASEYVAALWPAVSSAAAMAGVVFLAERTILGSAHDMTTLVSKIALGAAAYAGALFVLHRKRVLRMRDFAMRLRSSRPPVPAA
jgi:teichuronic acid exporter